MPRDRRAVQLWMNLYHNGFFHRRGKPGDINVHGGDTYKSKKTALEHIDHDAGYLDTISFVLLTDMDVIENPEDSIPTPLSVTRKQIAAQSADWLNMMAP